MDVDRQRLIRSLFDEYIEMYASRDDRLPHLFSENITGIAGSSAVLVKDRKEWETVTRLDFAQFKERIRIEILDLALQDISDSVVIVTAFFHIHLPAPYQAISHETTRWVLVYRLEGEDWKIVHNAVSVPYHLAKDGETYPLKSLEERNDYLESLVEQRTRALEEANLQLELLSNTDGLTCVANRRRFDSELKKEWNRTRRESNPLAVILFDVDHFKQFNDHYGHLAGDDCLCSLAQVLLQEVRRAGELVARYGGEEFVVLLSDSNLEAALETAQRIQRAVRSLALVHAEMPHGFVSFSFGVASMTPSLQHDSDELVRQADLALYRAKALGRNRIECATE